MRKFKLLVLILGIFSFLGFQNIKANPDNATVEIHYFKDGTEDISKKVTITNMTIGQILTHNAEWGVGDQFLFWTVNGAVRRDLPQNLTIKVPSKIILGVHFSSSGNKAGVFLDSNLKFLGISFTNPATPPPTATLSKPFSDFKGWALVSNYDTLVSDFTLVESKTFFVAKYELSAGLDGAAINFNGDTFYYLVNEVATLTAPMEITNPVWKDYEGKILGYGRTLKYTILNSGVMNVTVEEGTKKDAYILFRGPYFIRTYYPSYVAKFDVGTKEVIDFGFILDDGATKIPAKSLNPLTNEFLMSFKAGRPVASYVTYMEGETAVTIHTEFYSVKINDDPTLYVVGGHQVTLPQEWTYALNTLVVNGVDKMSEVVNGQYTLTVNENCVVTYTASPTIKTVKSTISGNEVTFTGNVIKIDGNDVYVEDDFAAIALLNSNKPANLQFGDKVSVTGIKSFFYGYDQITNATITIISSDSSYVIKVNTIPNFSFYEAMKNQSKYVNVANLEPKGITVDNRNLIFDKDFCEGIIRASSSSGAVFDIIKNAVNAKTINLTNVFLDWENGKPLFVIGNVSQIEVIEYTDQEKIDLIKSELSSKYNPYADAKVYHGANIGLMTTHPKYGGTIVWSFNPASAVNAGKWVYSGVGDYLEVTLTATITVNGTTVTTNPDTDSMCVFIYNTPTQVEEMIYRTGFEAFEEFVAGTTYNNPNIVNSGPAGMVWGTYYGTPSLNNAIVGNQSLQMRWYQATPDNLAYTFTNFDIMKITKVSFKAYSDPNINLIVSVSKDSGLTWENQETIPLFGSFVMDYDYNVPGPYTNGMRIKFALSYTEGYQPGDGAKLIIDDVRITGLVPYNEARIDLDQITFLEDYEYAQTLTLPTTGFLYNSAITWSSNKPAVISNTGVITLPLSTTRVVLTATATGNYNFTKEYYVNVIGTNSKIDADLAAALEIDKFTLNEPLPYKTPSGNVITWSSNDPAITISGGGYIAVVTQHDTNNINVSLTATITSPISRSKTFNVVVLSVTNELTAELNNMWIPEETTYNLYLAEKTYAGDTILWSSSNPEIIATDGTVTRPVGANVTVTLTATITRGSVTVTKTYDVIVLKV